MAPARRSDQPQGAVMPVFVGTWTQLGYQALTRGWYEHETSRHEMAITAQRGGKGGSGREGERAARRLCAGGRQAAAGEGTKAKAQGEGSKTGRGATHRPT